MIYIYIYIYIYHKKLTYIYIYIYIYDVQLYVISPLLTNHLYFEVLLFEF